MKVRNFESPASGREVANQFLIDDVPEGVFEDGTPHGKGVFFQSYESLIAFEEYRTRRIFLDEDKWDYSRTTGKYRNIFLGESIKETRKKISAGVYKLVQMNKRGF